MISAAATGGGGGRNNSTLLCHLLHFIAVKIAATVVAATHVINIDHFVRSAIVMLAFHSVVATIGGTEWSSGYSLT